MRVRKSRKSVAPRGVYTSTIKIVLVYLVVGVLWIVLSDTLLLHISSDTEIYRRLQTAKGWLYVLVTAILLLGLIHRELTDRNRIHRRLEEMVEERELLMKELNHRVRNSLQVALSIFNMQMFEVDESETSFKVLIKTRNRLQAISTCLDTLYSSSSLIELDLGAYLQKVAQNSVESLKQERGEVSIEYDMEFLHVSVETAIPLGIVVNELVENSLLHAFSFEGGDKESRRIRLSLKRGEEEKLVLTVGDNGRGLFPDIAEMGGIGYTLVDSLLKQIGAVYRFDNDDGTMVQITL